MVDFLSGLFFWTGALCWAFLLFVFGLIATGKGRITVEKANESGKK